MNELNLIKPIDPKKQRELQEWYYRSIYAFLSLFLLIGFLSIYKLYTIATLHYEHKALLQAHPLITFTQADKEALQDRYTLLRHRQEKIEYYKRKTYAPHHFIEQLSQCIPESIMLTCYQQEKYNIQLEGKGFEVVDILLFIDRLNESAHFNSVTLISLSHQLMNSNDQKIINFVLKGKLNLT